MKILAHRGMWLTDADKNMNASFQRAFQYGFGIETDIREYKGELVISHDIVLDAPFYVKDFLDLYIKAGADVRLALNVKTDGIQERLKGLLRDFNIKNYFVFDMSIPEMVVYRESNFSFYCRQSDIERECILYDSAEGVWMDSFYNFNWLLPEMIANHLENGKKVCIVSPELHQKEYLQEWYWLRQIVKEMNVEIEICTDMPEKAKEFFNGKD